MDQATFKTVFDSVMSQSQDVLVKKAAEYATNEDRLHNFKVSAGFIQGTPKQALWGYLTKHLVSLSDMVKTDKEYDSALWDEKIGDAINYLILLRALQYEESDLYN